MGRGSSGRETLFKTNQYKMLAFSFVQSKRADSVCFLFFVIVKSISNISFRVGLIAIIVLTRVLSLLQWQRSQLKASKKRE